MSIRERLKAAAETLRRAGVPDAEYDSAALLAFLTGRPPLEMRLDFEHSLTEAQEAAFRGLLERRAGREPLQYILGTAVFRGMELKTAPGVLIPRPETELLAGWALEALREKHDPEILDLCCGSGCLGLSLWHELPGARVTLTDLSEAAAALSEENRRRLGADCEILTGDLFAPVRGRRFDCVLSNPPYIPSADCDTLQAEVMREPRLALDGGADGLDFYRRIAREAPAHLKPGGLVLMETGDGEAEKAAELLREGGAERTEIRKDDAGIPRMVLGRYPAQDAQRQKMD